MFWYTPRSSPSDALVVMFYSALLDCVVPYCAWAILSKKKPSLKSYKSYIVDEIEEESEEGVESIELLSLCPNSSEKQPKAYGKIPKSPKGSLSPRPPSTPRSSPHRNRRKPASPPKKSPQRLGLSPRPPPAKKGGTASPARPRRRVKKAKEGVEGNLFDNIALSASPNRAKSGRSLVSQESSESHSESPLKKRKRKNRKKVAPSIPQKPRKAKKKLFGFESTKKNLWKIPKFRKGHVDDLEGSDDEFDGTHDLRQLTAGETEALAKMQKDILKGTYPYGKTIVGIALSLSFLWLATCSLIIAVLGINFDIESIRGLSDSLLKESSSNCGGLDIPIETSLNVQSTQTFIGLHPSEIVGKNLYNSMSDSGVLFLNTFFGFLMSIFATEPICMFFYAFYCVLLYDKGNREGHEDLESDEKVKKEMITEDDFISDPQFVLEYYYASDNCNLQI